jgi:hypothetical protein
MTTKVEDAGTGAFGVPAVPVQGVGASSVLPYRTIAIPERRAPASLRERGQTGSSYPCVVCGVHVRSPKWELHMISGGGVALHPADEALFAADEAASGGDMGFYPIGADCLRQHPELRPFVLKVGD